MPYHSKQQIAELLAAGVSEAEIAERIGADPHALKLFDQLIAEEERRLFASGDLDDYTLERLGDQAGISADELERSERRVWAKIRPQLTEQRPDAEPDELCEMLAALDQVRLVYTTDADGNQIMIDRASGRVVRQLQTSPAQNAELQQPAGAHRQFCETFASEMGEVFALPNQAGQVICRWQHNRLDILFQLCQALRCRYRRIIMQPETGIIREAVIENDGAFLAQVERDDYQIMVANGHERRRLFSFSLREVPYFHPLHLAADLPASETSPLVRRLACADGRILVLGFSPRHLNIAAEGFPPEVRIKVYREQVAAHLLNHSSHRFRFAFPLPQPGKELYVATRYQEKEQVLVVKFMEA